MRNIRCLIFVAFLLTAYYTQSIAATREQFGTQWVRSHKFTLMSWYDTWYTDYMSLYQGCGLNSMFCKYQTVTDAAPAYGLAKHILLSAEVLNQATIERINSLALPDEENAWYIRDEPAMELIPGIADIAAYLRQNRPNSLIHINVAGWGYDREEQIIAAVQPDIYMWGVYPYCVVGVPEDPDADGESYNLFYYQRGMYETAKSHGLPVFFWVEAFSGSDWYRMPSESELRMLVYSSLTTGCKGLAYFIFTPYPISADPNITTALLLGDGQPGPEYQYAQAITSEVAGLGVQLRFLGSTDYRFVLGPGNMLPSANVSAWSLGAGGDTYITGIAMLSSPGAKRDGMIGFFTDDAGRRYFMLTNLYRGVQLDSASAQLNFRITFDDSISQIYRLNRSTGQQEIVPMTGLAPGNHYLDISLPGGTGDLFAYTAFPDVADHMPPSGAISINSGAAYANTTAVTLNLPATDDSGRVSHMRFSNDGTNWSTWEVYTTSKAWSLPAGDGEKSVSVQFRDTFDNISTIYTDSIVLDTTLPEGSVQINSNALYTNSTAVILTLAASDTGSGVSQAKFSNDGQTWSDWMAYETAMPWTLSSGDGYKYARAQFKDAAGNVSPTAMDWIILDTVSPTAGTASSPTSAAGNPIVVSYSGASDSRSGLKKVELWYRKGSGGGWVNSELTSTTSSGSFDFTASGSGTYYFDLVAEDKADNRSATPTGVGDTSTVLTLPALGVINKSVVSTLMTTAASKYDWVLWGRVSESDASGFKIDDGSGVVIKVVPADSTVHDGDYVSVKGSLNVGTTPPTLTSQQVNRY